MNRPSNLLAAWGVSLGAALLLALTLFAVGAGARSWWGVSAITYLSPPVQWGLVVLAVVGLLASLLGGFSKISVPGGLRRRVWIVLPVLGACLFVLRQAFPLSGDGWLLVGLSERLPSILSIWTSGRPWPLSLSFFASFHRLSGLSGQATYQLFSILSGMAILVVLAWLARRLGFSFRQSVLLGVPLFSSGVLALFAGYVENYPTLVLIWCAALLYAMACVKNRRLPFWPLIIAAPFLVSWHAMSLMLFPAIGFAGFVRARRSAISPKSFLFLLMGLSGLLLLLYLLTPLSQGVKLFLPLSPRHVADGYSLFSGHHVFDFVSEILLVAPLMPFFLAAAWTLRPKMVRDGGLQVLALAALLGLAAAFVFDPELGMARDWDLLAVMLLPLNLLAGYAMARAEPAAALQGRIAGACLVSFLTIALPFVLVNHQFETSVDRYQDLLRAHPERSAYGWEILASFMGDRGDLEARLMCLESAAQVSPNQRYLDLIAMLALNMGYREKARHAVEKLRGADPRIFPEAHNYFLFFLEFGFLKDVERMLPFLRELAPPGESLDDYFQAVAKAKADSTYPIADP